jgi:patatin-like phospholipase/acyl hydrolase
MKKTEDYIKPVILEGVELDNKQIEDIKDYFSQPRERQELEKSLAKLSRRQKHAPTTNGPHPHH